MSLKPRPIVTWDKVQRIIRHQEIWNDKNSVVHRLPQHYKSRYWTNLLRDRTPVHWRPFETRYTFDPKKNLWSANTDFRFHLDSAIIQSRFQAKQPELSNFAHLPT